jgi:hypothetical protein
VRVGAAVAVAGQAVVAAGVRSLSRARARLGGTALISGAALGCGGSFGSAHLRGAEGDLSIRYTIRRCAQLSMRSANFGVI